MNENLPDDFVVFGETFGSPRRFKKFSDDSWDQLTWSHGEWKFFDNNGINTVANFYHAADQVFTAINNWELTSKE